MAQKPAPADAAEGSWQSEVVMIAEFGAQPGGGIAEALACVASPGGSAVADVGTGELVLAPFGAPSELARALFGYGASELGFEDTLPAPAGLVR